MCDRIVEATRCAGQLLSDGLKPDVFSFPRQACELGDGLAREIIDSPCGNAGEG